MKKLVALAIIFGVFVSCQKPVLHRMRIDGLAQGTFYTITYMSPDGINYKSAIDSLLQEIDKSVSLWDTTSTLHQVNANQSVPLDSIFRDNFRKAQYISQLTDGAFDITVGMLVNAWGFGNARRQNLTKAEVDSMRKFVGYQKLRLENNTIVKTYPQIQIDFNAIAQGYTSDRIGDFLENKNIFNYIVDIGGEVLAKGRKENGNFWTCGIESPAKDSLSEIKLAAAVNLNNKALVTSGNSRKYYIKDGVRYSHTIDPQSGYPVRHRLLSATVLADHAWEADGLATAFMVMGLDRAKTFLTEHPQYEAYFLFTDVQDSLQTFMTEGMKKIMVK